MSDRDLGEHDEFSCTVCHLPWFDPGHRRLVSRDWRKPWRDHVGKLVPYRKWFTEKIPGGPAGNVLSADDGCLRIWGPVHGLDHIGMIWPLEVKSFGAPLDYATDLTFSAMAQPDRFGTPLVLTLIDGNVPGPLAHWPRSPWYGLPDELVVAQRIVLNGRQITESELIGYFTDPRRLGQT